MPTITSAAEYVAYAMHDCRDYQDFAFDTAKVRAAGLADYAATSADVYGDVLQMAIPAEWTAALVDAMQADCASTRETEFAACNAEQSARVADRAEFHFYSDADLRDCVAHWRQLLAWGVCADPIRSICQLAVARATLRRRA